MLSKHWICKERDARWLVTITDDVKRTSVPGGWHCHCWGCGPLAHAQKARASAAFCDPPPRRRRRRARRSRSGQPAKSEAQLTNSSCLSHARSNKSTSRNWKRNKQRWARKNDEKFQTFHIVCTNNWNKMKKSKIRYLEVNNFLSILEKISSEALGKELSYGENISLNRKIRKSERLLDVL